MLWQGWINHSGAPYQHKVWGSFLIHAARIFSGCALFPQKLTTFLIVIVTFKPTLNVQGQNSVIKIWQLIGGPLAAGIPSYGTTSTMVNPALAMAKYEVNCS